MSTMFLLPDASVTTTIALSAVRELSRVVVSLSDDLDKDIEKLRETLNLPRDPARWTIVLAARLSCHERVFQERLKAEMMFHRAALCEMYGGGESPNGDLLAGMSTAVLDAHQSFTHAEEIFKQFNCIYDGYASQLHNAERDRIQDAQPALVREYKMLQSDASALQHDFAQWVECFTLVLGNPDPGAFVASLQTRRFYDCDIFSRELASPFQLLADYVKTRQGIRDKCIEMRDQGALTLLSRPGDRVPAAELRSQLRRYEDLIQAILSGSARQSEAIRSIEMLVQDAHLHASAIFTAGGGKISLEKIHDVFRRYDELRVMCSRLVERSAQFSKAMAQHIVTLEKARDWL
ncbi:hypothetical protein FKP32DRAFT_1560308 [Trametes sanguinea]|nr:hypothetical protein FKP32DRAFT_1563207 [Trametes sanguinea]KAI9069127.1 hypothetical protein FKP32DRAFT_1560308 [Trametes sanguinea]